MRKNKSKYDRRSYHGPTYRLILQNEGCKWMPSRDKRDNIVTNYNSNNIIEIVYQKKIKEYNDTLLYFESLYEPGEEVDAEEYIFLKLPIEEKLKIPDSDFIFDGKHKSMMPAMGFGGRKERRNCFKSRHKDNWLHYRVRVPSLKRSNSEWKRFYNTFPEIAAEVRLGTRRFVNGAKLKYIW